MKVTEEQALAFRFRAKIAIGLVVAEFVFLSFGVLYMVLAPSPDPLVFVAALVAMGICMIYSRIFSDPRRVGIR